MTALQSDKGPRLFRDPFFNQWYCWDKEWCVCHGPFEDVVQAQNAAGYSTTNDLPPNCS